MKQTHQILRSESAGVTEYSATWGGGVTVRNLEDIYWNRKSEVAAQFVYVYTRSNKETYCKSLNVFHECRMITLQEELRFIRNKPRDYNFICNSSVIFVKRNKLWGWRNWQGRWEITTSELRVGGWSSKSIKCGGRRWTSRNSKL
jgi:hypothetical protein